MDEKIFKASFKRNIMVGVNVGIPISLILMIVTLAADLGEACAFIALALGILIGILWRTIIRPQEVVGINEDSVWFGTKRSKKHEFKLDESGFRLSTDIQRFLGIIPIVTRSLIVDTNGKRKIISCSFLSKSDFGHFSSLLNQRISKTFEKKINNRPFFDKAPTEFKEYNIPQKQILRKVKLELPLCRLLSELYFYGYLFLQ